MGIALGQRQGCQFRDRRSCRHAGVATVASARDEAQHDLGADGSAPSRSASEAVTHAKGPQTVPSAPQRPHFRTYALAAILIAITVWATIGPPTANPGSGLKP